MQFDNKKFESNVKTTMGTLDKLKEKLKFTDSYKGLEKLEQTANKVNLQKISSSLDTVTSKFSNLGIVGTTALVNLTNSAVNAGKKLVKSLTVDQITAGWDKYGQKTASVQTIMNATGKSIDEVNEYLEKLMWFSDETSYSFTDMTSGLATMVSSGGDIRKLIPLITGVANATAFAGKGAAEFSRVLQYGVNQAYSLGYMQVQDWKTIEGATVNSKQLMEALIGAGEALGKIEKGSVTTQTFRSSLKDAWLDTEVMEAGFGKFAEFSEAVYDMVSSGKVDTASDAISKLSGKYGDLGEKAFKSAQEAKTFQEAIDATKDAVSSSWMRTFEIIFGTYDKSKNLWTGLADVLWDVFASGGEKRNAFLEKVLSFNPWEAILQKLDDSGLGKIKDTAKAISDLTDKVEYYREVVTSVWRGDYNNRGDNPDRLDLLTAAGYNYDVVQELVNKGYDYRNKITSEDIAEAYKKAGVSMDEATTSTKNLDKALDKLTDEQLRSLNFTEEEIKMFRDLQTEAERTGVPIEELLEKMETTDGRTLLIESLKNASDGLIGTFTALKEAWAEIFPPISTVRMYTLIDSITEFSEKLRLTDAETGELNETGENLKRTFEGILAIVDVVTTFVSGPTKLAFQLLQQFLAAFDMDILDFTASIGDAAVKFRDWVDSVLDFTPIFEKLAPHIRAAGEAIADWIEKTKPLEKIATFFKTVFNKAMNGAKKAFEFLSPPIIKAKDAIVSWLEATKPLEKVAAFFKKIGDAITKFAKSVRDSSIGQNVIAGLTGGLKNGAIKVWNTIVNIAKGMIDKIKSVLGIHSPSTEFKEVGEHVMTGLGNGLKEGVGSIVDIISDLCSKILGMFSGLDFGALKDLFSTLAKISPKFKVLNTLTGYIGLFEFMGSDVVSGLVNGLTSGFDTVWNTVASLASKVIEAFKNILGIHSPSAVFFALGGFIIAGLIGGLMAESTSVTDALKTIGTTIVDFFSGLDLGTVIAAGLGIGALYVTKQLIDVMGQFAAASKGIGKLTSSLAGLVDTINSGITGKLTKTESKWAEVSKAILRIAISIGILVGAVYLLTTVDSKKLGTAVFALAGIMVMMGGLVVGLMAADKYLVKEGSSIDKTANSLLKIAGAIGIMAIIARMLGGMDPAVLKQGGTAIANFVIIIAGLMAATRFLASGPNTNKIGSTLLKVSGAILIMTIVAKMLGGMDPTALKQGGTAITHFVLVIAALMLITKFLTGSSNVDKIGGTLFKIAGAIAIMAFVVKMLGTMDPAALKQGGSVIAHFVIIIAGLMLATKLIVGSKNIDKIGGALFKIAGAILIMALVVRLLGSMDPAALKQGGTAIANFVVIIAGLILATKLIVGSKNIDKIGSALIKIAGAIGIMALVAILLGFIKPEYLVKGGIMVTLFAGIIVGLMAATKLISGSKNVDKIGDTIFNVAKAIAVMAVAVALLSLIKKERLIVATACMTALVGVFGLALYAGKNAKKSLGSIIAMTAAVVAIAVVLWRLSELPAENTIGAAIALSVVLAAMALSLKAISKIKKPPFAAIGALAVLGLVVAELAGIMAIISKVTVSIDSVLTLSVLILAMSGVLFILGKLPTAPFAAIGALAVLGLVVAELAIILGLISHFNVSTSISTILSLSTLLLVMTGVLAALSLLGPMASGAFVGIGALAVLGLVVAELAIILAVIEHFDLAPSMETVKSLSLLLVSMSGVLLVLGVVGLMGPAAFIGLGALATLIVGLGALLVGIGALVDQFPALETFLDKGIPILEKIGYALGSFFGNILGGFLGGITAGLPQIGTDLSMFMMNAMPFIMGAKLIDESAMNGVKALSEAILIITAANLLESITSWLTGSSSIETFGSQLKTFAGDIVEFSSIISGNIDEGAITAAGNAGKALAEMADTLPKTGGVVQWFVGTTDISLFGTQLTKFGNSLVSFSNVVSGKINEDAITAASNAGKTMAEMAGTIPKWGGVVGWFTGTTDLATFGSQLKTFGEAIVEFSTTVTDKVNEAAVKSAANCGKILSNLSNNLPKSGGIKSWWEGDNSLTDFAKDIVSFADELSKLDTSGMESLGSLNEKLSKLATTAVADFANSITNSKDTILKVATTLMTNFITGMDNKKKDVGTTAKAIGKNAANEFGNKDNVSAAKSAGKDLGSGLVNGINAKKTAVYNAAYALGQKAVQGEKDGQESASPSKATIRAGKWLGEGLIIGMKRMTGKVYGAGNDLGETATDTMSSVISKITDFINSDIETQPTIRPVLDLSSVQSGANSISGMLSGRRTISVNTASVDSISESMNRNQNRANSSDVVSAIKGLRSDMANMPRNSYSINGITYGDGTEVSDAVKALVRAAKIDRRV